MIGEIVVAKIVSLLRLPAIDRRITRLSRQYNAFVGTSAQKDIHNRMLNAMMDRANIFLAIAGDDDVS